MDNNMLIPMDDFFLVKVEEAPTQTESGTLDLPEKTADTPVSGVVIRSGNNIDKSRIPDGSVIYFKMWAGEPVIKYDGKEYKVINSKDVLAYVPADVPADEPN